MTTENSIRRSVSIVLGGFVHRFRTSLIVLLSMLVFVSLAASQGSDGEIRVKIYSYKRIGVEKPVPLGNVTVKIGPSTVITNAAGEASTVVPRGDHHVKAYLQGFIVSDMSVYPDALGGTHGGGPAKSDEGDLDLPFRYKTIYEEEKSDSTLGVYMKPGDPQQKDKFEPKRFSVVVQTPGCRDPNCKDLTIKIGNTEVTNFKVDRNDNGELIASGQTVELKPGPYQIQASGPGHSDTVVALVEVVDTLHEYGNFFPKSKGRAVDVVLDERMWKSEAGAALKISLNGNCADPDFYDLKVLAVTGKVEIIGPGKNDKPRQAKVNDSLFRFQTFTTTIRTDSGGSIILESEHGHVITIAESTEVQTNLIMTADGREKLEAFVKMGKIQIKRVKPESDPGIKVRTPTAGVVDFETIYMVSHDEKTNVTTVGVEEGKVEVTPINSSLKPFTLEANQQVQVSDKSVSAITHYSGESTRATRVLLYVGIGAAALVGLLVVIGGITFLYRRVNRSPVQPAFQQSGVKVEATPAYFASPAVATNEWRCPNPQCGKLIPAGKKFCTACGSTRSDVKFEATPLYAAAPAVASRERRCPNPQCGKLVPASKTFCTACGTRII